MKAIPQKVKVKHLFWGVLICFGCKHNTRVVNILESSHRYRLNNNTEHTSVLKNHQRTNYVLFFTQKRGKRNRSNRCSVVTVLSQIMQPILGYFNNPSLEVPIIALPSLRQHNGNIWRRCDCGW